MDLVTIDSFADFELAFDFKLSEGSNSGVKYLIQDSYFGEILGARRGPKALGFEMQLVDDQRDADAIGSPKQRTGSLYYLFAPTHQMTVATGAWNSARLVVRAARVEHWVNGQQVLTFELHSADLRQALDQAIASGGRPMTMAGLTALQGKIQRVTPIALQHHFAQKSDGVWFRNIKIKPD